MCYALPSYRHYWQLKLQHNPWLSLQGLLCRLKIKLCVNLTLYTTSLGTFYSYTFDGCCFLLLYYAHGATYICSWHLSSLIHVLDTNCYPLASFFSPLSPDVFLLISRLDSPKIFILLSILLGRITCTAVCPLILHNCAVLHLALLIFKFVSSKFANRIPATTWFHINLKGFSPSSLRCEIGPLGTGDLRILNFRLWRLKFYKFWFLFT